MPYCSACSDLCTYSSQCTKGDKLTTITCYLTFSVDKRENSVVQISTLISDDKISNRSVIALVWSGQGRYHEECSDSKIVTDSVDIGRYCK